MVLLLVAPTLFLSAPVKASSILELTGASYFTNSDGEPLQLDAQGNPMIGVVLGPNPGCDCVVVKSTNPGQVLDWLKLTLVQEAPLGIQHLRISETLPVDWACGPCDTSTIHVFRLTSSGTVLDITGQVTITVTPGNPEAFDTEIPDEQAEKIQTVGDGILLSAVTSYTLKGTSIAATNFPITYTDRFVYAIGSDSLQVAASFVAYAKVVGGGGGHAVLS